MPKVTKELIQELRARTGAGLMDCKKALVASDGNLDEAITALRKAGAALAEKRAGKETAQGIVHAYIHPGAQVGVLVEINCETDFVARTADMEKFASNIAMQIAAFRPLCIAPAEVASELIEKEKEIYRQQLKDKPAAVIDKIIEGKLAKYYSEICLLNQPFIKDEKITIDDLLKDLITKTGERIVIRRFTRYEIGT